MPEVTYVDHVRAAGRRVADLARTGDLAAPVPACPGWTLLDVVHHLGEVHRWARLAVLTAAEPRDEDIDGPPDDPAALGDWMDAGLGRLADALTGLDPAAPTWHPFPTAQVAGVWPRRQAIETTLHRWDAESSQGSPAPIDPTLAADAVAEYFDIVAPRLVARDGITLPVGTVQLAGLTVTSDGSTLTTNGSVARDAGAEDLLLGLWRRQPLEADGLLAEWLAVGGN